MCDDDIPLEPQPGERPTPDEFTGEVVFDSSTFCVYENGFWYDPGKRHSGLVHYFPVGGWFHLFSDIDLYYSDSPFDRQLYADFGDAVDPMCLSPASRAAMLKQMASAGYSKDIHEINGFTLKAARIVMFGAGAIYFLLSIILFFGQPMPIFYSMILGTVAYGFIQDIVNKRYVDGKYEQTWFHS